MTRGQLPVTVEFDVSRVKTSSSLHLSERQSDKKISIRPERHSENALPLLVLFASALAEEGLHDLRATTGQHASLDFDPVVQSRVIQDLQD